MAGKKAKPKQTVQKASFGKLQPDCVLCPICRTIFDHPVTLPCDHAFCRPCFEGSMENANLMCPLCRLRVGSWYRRTKKDGKLVNEELWKAVQQQYPLEVKNKLQGLDNDIEEGKPVIRVCNPGEIRQEYEKERRKYLEEQQKSREVEENASAVLIKKLTLETGYKETVEEERLRWNAVLAKKLSGKLLMPSTSKQTPQKPKVSMKFGPMDRLVQTGDWISTHGFSQQTKIPPKKKQPQISPQFPKACFSKEYKCHVIPVPKTQLRCSREKSCLDFGFKPTGGTEKCLKLVAGQRKLCVSGCKSSTSAENSDVIDQECRFYFKPIDSQRRFHVPGTIPRKVVAVKGVRDDTVSVGPPSGKVHCLGEVSSAFSKVSAKGETVAEIEKNSSPDPVELQSEPRKRTTLLNRQSPMKKMRVQSESEQERMESPPFYGFDNSDKTLRESPFSGFDANNVRDSENKTQTLADFISKLRRCESTERLEIASGSSGRASSSSKENNFQANIPKTETAATKPCRSTTSPSASEDRRRVQEEADYQLAKKLQAEFDLIEAPVRTRGSRRRQITLDEMLVV
ncbi:E3 ubiquitin-protein ligase RNF168 [Dendroctonus ponderosae]|nr:E3 ubiquitin-protein ligase RNF168 [Dendroctonus ponderosae]KAH1004935.1 hypothetical protein HUJ05_005700 [Dendroctonus ponderosae]